MRNTSPATPQVITAFCEHSKLIHTLQELQQDMGCKKLQYKYVCNHKQNQGEKKMNICVSD